MKAVTKWWLAIGTVALAAGGAVAWGLAATGDPIRDEYPDAPFSRVGPDFPRIIVTDDLSSLKGDSTKEAYRKAAAAFRERSEATRRVLARGRGDEPGRPGGTRGVPAGVR